MFVIISGLFISNPLVLEATDVIVLSNAKTNQWIVEYIYQLGKIVIIHKNPLTIDPNGEFLPHLYFHPSCK